MRKYSLEMLNYLKQNAINYTANELVLILKDKFNVIMAKDGLFSIEPQITKLGHLCSKMNIKSKGEQNDTK